MPWSDSARACNSLRTARELTTPVAIELIDGDHFDRPTPSQLFFIYGTPKSTNNFFQNNISEGNGRGYHAEATYASSIDTRVYGHISLNDIRGTIAASGNGTAAWNLDMRDFVTIRPSELGHLMLSARSS